MSAKLIVTLSLTSRLPVATVAPIAEIIPPLKVRVFLALALTEVAASCAPEKPELLLLISRVKSMNFPCEI